MLPKHSLSELIIEFVFVSINNIIFNNCPLNGVLVAGTLALKLLFNPLYILIAGRELLRLVTWGIGWRV